MWEGLRACSTVVIEYPGLVVDFVSPDDSISKEIYWELKSS